MRGGKCKHFSVIKRSREMRNLALSSAGLVTPSKLLSHSQISDLPSRLIAIMVMTCELPRCSRSRSHPLERDLHRPVYAPRLTG